MQTLGPLRLARVVRRSRNPTATLLQMVVQNLYVRSLPKEVAAPQSPINSCLKKNPCQHLHLHIVHRKFHIKYYLRKAFRSILPSSNNIYHRPLYLHIRQHTAHFRILFNQLNGGKTSDPTTTLISLFLYLKEQCLSILHWSQTRWIPFTVVAVVIPVNVLAVLHILIMMLLRITSAQRGHPCL